MRVFPLVRSVLRGLAEPGLPVEAVEVEVVTEAVEVEVEVEVQPASATLWD